jgi:diguanylate cyclase (GGDEF)-like protein
MSEQPRERGLGAAGSGTGARSADSARLRSLLGIAKAVGAVSRFEDLIELTAEEARRALDAASLTVSRWDRDQGALRTLVNVGLLGPDESRFPEEELYPVAQWPKIRRLLESRAPVLATDEEDDEEAELLRGAGKASALAVPIVVEAKVWGELYATRSADQRRFQESDVDFAVAVATQVAAGVVQADHFARIERLAFQDPLTGLANRRAVDERLEQDMAAYAESGRPVAIVLADINRLKQVNDSFGHEAGDRLIVAVGEAVSRASALIPGSLAARIGGDEFCIVLSGVPTAEVLDVGRELCRIVDAQPMSTGVSCGVAATDTAPGPIESPVRLFRLADAAQYRAKRSGSHEPVLAGHGSGGPADRPPDPPTDRRVRRGRLAVDVGAALESGLETLDRLGDTEARVRVETVADHVLTLVDGAAWWVSWVEPGSRDLLTVSTSVQRGSGATEGSGPRADEMVYDLAEYPVTDAAMRRARSFRAELGMPDNDPAEEAALVAAGYTGVLGAGVRTAEGGWLVEIYGDSISLPADGCEPLLRALLAVAVTGATERRAFPEPDLDRLPAQAPVLEG